MPMIAGRATDNCRSPQLTTAHLDHNPANCSPENLKALCAPCHLILDGSDWNRTRKAREMKQRERHGQLTLDLELEGDE